MIPRLRLAPALCLALLLTFVLSLTVFAYSSLQNAHDYYASAKAKKYYYCDDDPAWKDLSAKYLLKFDTEAEAKAKTGMVLHRPCKN